MTRTKTYLAAMLLLIGAAWAGPATADDSPTPPPAPPAPPRAATAPVRARAAARAARGREVTTPVPPAVPRAPFLFFRREPRDIDRKLSASPRGSVTIVNPAGSIVVTGSEQNEVHVTGTLGGGVRKMIFTRDGDEVNLEVVSRENYPLGDASELEIQLPAASRVDIKTFNATIEVGGVTGSVDAESMSGDVTVNDTPRLVHAACVSCDMQIDGAAEVVRAETVNGAIHIAKGRGFVELSTVSGLLDMLADKVNEVNMSAVSGAIHFQGVPGRNGSLQFQTHNGPIELVLPGDLAADFELVNYSGTIESQLGRLPVARAGEALRELRFSTGSGGARIKAETFSGSIDITKH